MVPIYIHYLGIEGYGVIAVFIALQAILLNFEFGIGAGLVQSLARLSLNAIDRRYAASLAGSAEVVYLFFVVIALVIALYFESSIAHMWIKVGEITRGGGQCNLIQLAIIALAFQWPASLYSSGLIGIQRQDRAALTLASISSLRAVSTFLVLSNHGSLVGFFGVQIFFAVLLSLCMRMQLFRILNKGLSASYTFRLTHIKAIANFSSWMGVVSLVAILIPHIDKIILSGFLDLKQLGFYALVSTLGAGISFFTVPIFNLAYPHFTRLIHLGEADNLIQSYYGLFRITFTFLMPITLFFILFGEHIIFVVSGERDFPIEIEAVLSLLAISNFLVGLMHIPYAVQLASGQPKAVFFVNLIGFSVFATSLVYLSNYYGILGGGISWVIYSIIFSYGIIRVLVPNIGGVREHLRKLGRSVLPVIPVIILGVLMERLTPIDLTRVNTLVVLSFSILIFYLVTFYYSKDSLRAFENSLRAVSEK